VAESDSNRGDLPFFYANTVEMLMGPFDLTIDFGFKSPEAAKRGSPDWDRLARVSMSPSHAKSMLKLLLDHIQAYEEQFGMIPSPHYDSGEGQAR
jgi:hypothetical protein